MAVYRDSFERRRLWAHRLAFLHWSFPVGSPFGVAVRVAWTAPVPSERERGRPSLVSGRPLRSLSGGTTVARPSRR